MRNFPRCLIRPLKDFHGMRPDRTCRSAIASEAEKYKSELLSSDDGCEYDQVIEINLSELEPHVNGPFTPDLATPIGQLGETAKKNGWPLEVCMHGLPWIKPFLRRLTASWLSIIKKFLLLTSGQRWPHWLLHELVIRRHVSRGVHHQAGSETRPQVQGSILHHARQRAGMGDTYVRVWVHKFRLGFMIRDMRMSYYQLRNTVGRGM